MKKEGLPVKKKIVMESHTNVRVTLGFRSVKLVTWMNHGVVAVTEECGVAEDDFEQFLDQLGVIDQNCIGYLYHRKKFQK